MPNTPCINFSGFTIKLIIYHFKNENTFRGILIWNILQNFHEDSRMHPRYSVFHYSGQVNVPLFFAISAYLYWCLKNMFFLRIFLEAIQKKSTYLDQFFFRRKLFLRNLKWIFCWTSKCKKLWTFVLHPFQSIDNL